MFPKMNSKISTEEMNRIWGCFYGQIVGDALGCRYEFLPAETAQKLVNSDKKYGFLGLLRKPYLPMLGASDTAGSMLLGQFTDDSEMALCLARSIVARGKFDQLDVALSYAYWMHTGPITAGKTTKNALQNACYAGDMLTLDWKKEFTDVQKHKIFNKIQANVNKFNGNSLSNGFLMRISPLAIAYRNADRKILLRLAAEDTQITHNNPITWDAVGVYVIALAALLKSKSRKEAYNEALKTATTETVKGHLEAAKTHAIPVKVNGITWKTPELEETTEINGDGGNQGYMGVALQWAFYELLHAESFASGLENVISRGGDTDTNGCIAAALLGAYFGVDSIPKDWIETVRNADPFLGCRNNERTRISMNDFCIKDADELVPKLANIIV